MTDPNGPMLESWQLSLHDTSPGTASLYLRCLRWFATWLAEQGRPADAPGDLVAVSRQDAEAWFTAQRAAGLSAATIRSRWIALRNFYGWLTDEEEVSANPMARVKVARPSPEPVRVLENDQIRSLFKACEGTGFLERRDMAMFRLLAATGLRLAELADLSVEDLDLARRVVYVQHGKGDRARFARFDATTSAALDRYKRARGRRRHAGVRWFWLSRGATVGHVDPRRVAAPGRDGRHRPRPPPHAPPDDGPPVPRSRWHRGGTYSGLGAGSRPR